jgi:hypothetical protein
MMRIRGITERKFTPSTFDGSALGTPMFEHTHRIECPAITLNININPIGPTDVRQIKDQLHALGRMIGGLTKMEIDMNATTQALVTAVQALSDNSAKVDAAIDQLVAAQQGGDDAAVAQAVTTLQNLKADQDTHLAGLAAAVPPVVTAPPDNSQVPPLDTSGSTTPAAPTA